MEVGPVASFPTRREAIRRVYPEVAEAVLVQADEALSVNTRKRYDGEFSRWAHWARGVGLNALETSVPNVARYLLEGKPSASAAGWARALTALSVDGAGRLAEDPLLKKIIKGKKKESCLNAIRYRDSQT